MLYKKLLFLLIFSSLSIYSSAQEKVQDFGTFVMYKNPKYIEQFTNQKFEEIKATIESKRQEHTELRWDITDYTYVIIKPKDMISHGSTPPVSNNQTEEGE